MIHKCCGNYQDNFTYIQTTGKLLGAASPQCIEKREAHMRAIWELVDQFDQKAYRTHALAVISFLAELGSLIEFCPRAWSYAPDQDWTESDHVVV